MANNVDLFKLNDCLSTEKFLRLAADRDNDLVEMINRSAKNSIYIDFLGFRFIAQNYFDKNFCQCL